MLHCLSKSQVDDIVRRTRIESPPGFDPEELKRDLEAAWDLRTGYADETSKSELTKLRKYADQVSKAATRLVDLLEEFDPSARRMRSSLASSLNVDDVSLTKLHDDLGRLRDRAELLAQRQASMRDVIRLHPNEFDALLPGARPIHAAPSTTRWTRPAPAYRRLVGEIRRTDDRTQDEKKDHRVHK